MMPFSHIAHFPGRVRWVGMAVFLVSALASGLVIWNLEVRREELLRTYVGSLAADRAFAIETTIERALSSTYALSSMVHQARGEFANFDGVAREMMQMYPGLSSLGLSPDGVIRRVYPLAGNEKVLGFDQLHDPVQGVEAQLALRTRALTLAGPLELVQGGLGIVGRLPVFLGDTPGTPGRAAGFWGFTYVVIRLKPALDSSGLSQLAAKNMSYRLSRINPKTGATQVISSSTEALGSQPVERSLTVPNGMWTLAVAPTGGWGDPWGLTFKLLLGLMFSSLAAWVSQLLLQLKLHQRGLESKVAARTQEILTTQRVLEATLNAIPDPLLEIDADGTVRECRIPTTVSYAWQIERMLGTAMQKWLSEESKGVLMQALEEARNTGRSEGSQLAIESEWYELSIAQKGGDSGDSPRFIMLLRNISQRRQSELDLRVAATAFNAYDGMAITDVRGIVLRCNPAFTRITGYSEQEAVGQYLRLLHSGRHAASFYNSMWETIQKDGFWQGEIWNRRKNGEVYPDLRTASAVRDATGAITHVVNTFTDIKLRKASEEEINQLAYYDSLTHLPNRILLMDRLRQAIASSARSRQYGALQFIDLDNFKTLNDTLGHDSGDDLLNQVAGRLSECVRGIDTVARLGGDEFVVLLTQLGDEYNAAVANTELIGEKILAAIKRPYQLKVHEYELSASIGITLFQEEKQSIEDLLKQADLAMYHAKSEGRNTLRFYDPQMQLAVNRRMEMEADLRRALLRGQFELHYQTQVDTQGHTVGAEALLRWRHPERGLVAPIEFIPLAEETGQIIALGQWVLETACAQLRAWSERPQTRGLVLSINVSARQFRLPTFADDVLAALKASGAPASQLMLELTESLLLNDVEDTIAKMQRLKNQGVGFSLDDFGTGYSSLSYLKRLPLDQIKIDRSFVNDLLTNSSDSAIARTVVTLGHSLELWVVAEGVETVEQRDLLAASGCDAYQGYLFGRPVPVEEFEKLLG